MAHDISAIGEIHSASAVLLLGSGFSFESSNILNLRPPNGSALRQHFLQKLNLPADTTYDLQVLTEEFAHISGESIFRELNNLFRIDRVGPNQLQILKEGWLRIYTTNYDDCAEMCRYKLNQSTKSYSVADDLPNRLPSNSLVHLHGSLRDLREDNVLSQLVLGESSYVRQYIEKSPWYTQFQADTKFASHLFIIGYSLSDYHISALLLENPRLADRTFFIQSTNPNEIFERRTQSYGRTLFIGLEGFATALATLPRSSPITEVTKLRHFRALDPLRDKKGLRPPTAIEIIDLLTYGNFNYSRCVSTLPEQTYVISRADDVAQLVAEIQKSRSVIVDSRMGNGKTIFLYLAFLALAEHGFACFLFRGPGATLDQDIEALKSQKKLVILFDEYTLAQDAIEKIASSLPHAKIIVEIRTSILEVRYHEVSQVIPRPFGRIGLNRLSTEDVAAFENLCSKSGIDTGPLTQNRQKPEMRDILLQILESPRLRQKIGSELKELFESPLRRKILLLAMLFSKFRITTDAAFIKIVTGADPYREFRPIKELSDEIFETEIEDFRIRSAVFSEYTVKNFIEPNEISDCIVEATLAAAIRRNDRRYRVLMSNLMQYSNMKDLFQGRTNSVAQCVSIYERLRYDERVNKEPLFWLQYAIAMMDDDQLVPAEHFIETAYDRAAAVPGFQTYQIDTIAMRLLLLIETQSKGPVTRMDKLVAQLELITSMLAEDSHRAYAIKVLDGIEPFVRSRIKDLSVGDRNVLVFWISGLINRLSTLPVDYRARTGSDSVRTKLVSTKQVLLIAA